LNSLSIDAFHSDDTRGRHAARANQVLRVQLRQVDRPGDRFSEVRDGLQGLGHIVAYTDQYACEWSGGALKPRLAGSAPGHPFEYDWAWCYQYGWAVILLSALIPLVWFKVKGWF
jgi:hypothetical protein